MALLRKNDPQDNEMTCNIMHTMGWLRMVGTLELQASFAEYRLFNRAFLQKRLVILRSLLIPYLSVFLSVSLSTSLLPSHTLMHHSTNHLLHLCTKLQPIYYREPINTLTKAFHECMQRVETYKGFKRALYSIKRALYSIEKAPFAIKRTLHSI